MILVDSDCPCTKSELQVFEGRGIQTVLEHAQWVDVHPLNNVTQGNAPIEFTITGSPDEYIDLNDTMLHIRCKIVKADGSNFTAAEQTVAPVNDLLHAQFFDVKLTVGNVQIEGGAHLSHYKSYLSNLLLFNKATKSEQLVCGGHAKDTAGQMGAVEVNKGYKARRDRAKESKTMDLCGPLWLDLAHSPLTVPRS